MIVGIDHVQITVPAGAVAEARAFYCGLLGLREVEKPAALRQRGDFWLQAGDRFGNRVELIGPAAAPAEAAPPDQPRE